MNILTSSYTLDLSGVPTFTLTMYRELIKRGHKVTVFSPRGGELEREMNVVRNLDGLTRPDVILGQNKTCAKSLRLAFPDTPIVFYAHSIWIESEQPPDFPADFYFAINEAVRDNLTAKGVPSSKIVIVRDFVDTDIFKPVKPINKELKNVLFISNYKKWKNFRMVEAACKQLGLNLVCCGAPYGRSREVEKTINKADLIISWGRGILEAMSCGRAALSFEKMMGFGYITPEGYFESRKDNFCGYLSNGIFTNTNDLVREILKYDPNCSPVNRDLILKYHNVRSGVDQILEILTS